MTENILEPDHLAGEDRGCDGRMQIEHVLHSYIRKVYKMGVAAFHNFPVFSLYVFSF